MDTFSPNRALLNPKFEGYKLDLIRQEDAVARYQLQHRPTQVAASGKSPLSFQEVQSRITHNHIAVADADGRAIYVDTEYRVILIELDAESLQPSFRVVFEIPRPIQSSSVDSPHYEYPSAAFLSSTTVFVSDGHGSLYILRVNERGPSQSVGVYTLGDTSTDIPFRIHNVFRTSETVATAVLSSRNYEAKQGEAKPTRGKSPSSAFDVWAVKFNLISLTPHEDTRKLDVVWRRQGQDVPIYVAYDKPSKLYMLIGGSVYRDIGVLPPPSYEPTSDEIAPIPRLEENLDSNELLPPKPPPYSWTQTSDSVTVTFPLPANTPKSDIHVTFSQQNLTLHVQNDSLTSVFTPRYTAKTLWDKISPSSSFWTWDREAESSFGLLTLHLDKQHEGTKWMHVFASIGKLPSAEVDSEDVEVPETLDPSELWHIRESLEKYTAALLTGEDASGMGLGRGLPSLVEGEMDEEVDAAVGRSAYLTWVDETGATPHWVKNARETPFQLLSFSVPGDQDPNISLIVKNDLDGIVFSLSPATLASDGPTWTHTSTFSALAFVLASKQDTRFTYHIKSHAVFAFENGVQDRGGNVYIYRDAPRSEKWAKQAVLKVGDGNGGSLLGVGAANLPNKKRLLLCLTEAELILMKYI